MITRMSFHDFDDMWRKSAEWRRNSFSYEGKKILFNYLENTFGENYECPSPQDLDGEYHELKSQKEFETDYYKWGKRFDPADEVPSDPSEWKKWFEENDYVVLGATENSVIFISER